MGQSVGEGQQLISTERLDLSGFFDEAIGLKVLQGGPQGFALDGLRKTQCRVIGADVAVSRAEVGALTAGAS